MSKSQRTCLGCRKTFDAIELCRLQLQLSDEGIILALVISSTSVGGRGAWLCRAETGDFSGSEGRRGLVRGSCFAAAKQRKAFARGFRRDVPSHVVDGFLSTHGDD